MDEKISRYLKFWAMEDMDRPLLGYVIGGWIPAHRYQAARALLGNETITADMVRPEDFLEDYEAFTGLDQVIQDDVIRVAEPFLALPWVEAMLGCPVRSSGDSMWAEPWINSWDQLSEIQWGESQWRDKYLEFIQALVAHSNGRYPVGQAILRGPSDMITALRGASQAVFDMVDSPNIYRDLMARCTEFLIGLLTEQMDLVPEFHGGYGVGQYNLWAPGRFAWYQEDASSLMSPAIYRQYVLDCDCRLAGAFEYSLQHIHSSALFLLDEILENQSLRVVQINKDVDVEDIGDIIPYLKKAQNFGKNLLVRGAFTEEDYRVLSRELDTRGLYVQTIADTAEQARELMEKAVGIWTG